MIDTNPSGTLFAAAAGTLLALWSLDVFALDPVQGRGGAGSGVAPATAVVVASNAPVPATSVAATMARPATTGTSTTATQTGGSCGGTTVRTLPSNSASIVIDGVQHFQSGAAVYRAVVQAGETVYMQVR
jgi:hypothetical protein